MDEAMDKYERRLWERIDIPSEESCWLWTAGCNRGGYGQLSWDGRMVVVHRKVYELMVGEIPPGLVVDHLCRVRHCCNPDHLEVVTFRENVLRGGAPTAANAQKTHCPRGHRYDGRAEGGRERFCRTCRRTHQAAYDAKRRGKPIPGPQLFAEAVGVEPTSPFGPAAFKAGYHADGSASRL